MYSGIYGQGEILYRDAEFNPELLQVVHTQDRYMYEKPEKYPCTCGNPIIIHCAFKLPEQNGISAIEVLARPTVKTA